MQFFYIKILKNEICNSKSTIIQLKELYIVKKNHNRLIVFVFKTLYWDNFKIPITIEMGSIAF